MPPAGHPLQQVGYPRAQVCAGVLAGGRGQRMAGVDKGWVELGGQPMIAHVLAALQPQAGRILISANRNLHAYRALGHPVLPDSDPGFAGPLAGMAALMAASDLPWLLIVPCDSPALPPDLGPRLWRAAQRASIDVAVVQVQGRLEPVFALLRGTLRERLQADQAAGARKVGDWLREQNMVTVDFSDCADRFANVNTERDRERLANWLPAVAGRETP